VTYRHSARGDIQITLPERSSARTPLGAARSANTSTASRAAFHPSRFAASAATLIASSSARSLCDSEDNKSCFFLLTQ